MTNARNTQLTSAATKLNGTTASQFVLPQLSNGSPFLLFTSTDNACKSLADPSCGVCRVTHDCPTVTLESSNITSDTDTLTDVIAYHVMSGNFARVSTIYPNTTLSTTPGVTPLNDFEVQWSSSRAKGSHRLHA